MQIFRALAVALSVFVSLHATAREPVPVVDIQDVSVATISGKILEPAQVRQAIQSAALARQWTLVEQGPDTLLATLQVRGKHTVVTQVRYSGEKYSLIYRESINMKAGTKDGQQVIHPFYNRWVQNLDQSIRAALPRS